MKNLVHEQMGKPDESKPRIAGLDSLISPGSVAIIGASGDPTRIGGRPLDFMLKHGFQGDILPVNPNRSEVQGVRAFLSIADLPMVPEAAVIAVPGLAAIEALDELGKLGTRSAVIFSAGFGETGCDGIARQAQLAALAERYGMRILGPNCAGMFNARIGYFPIFASVFALPPAPTLSIGVVGQSGAVCTHLYAQARVRNIGIPLCLTTGNEADVDVADVIAWMANDDQTDVIAAYAEGFGNGERLIGALEAARRARKPIVLLKVGRSPLGQAATQSHTGAITGSEEVLNAVLGDYAVVRASSTEQMLDIAYAATRRIYPVSNSLGVISISGGFGIMVSDAADDIGLAMPQMPEAIQAALKKRAPFASPLNPVDCTAQAVNDPVIVREFAEAMVKEDYRSILAFFSTGGGPRLGAEIMTHMTAVKELYPDRLYVMSVIAPVEDVAEYERRGFLVFDDPTRAVTAIEAMGRFGAAFERRAVADLGDGGPVPPGATALNETALNEAAAKAVLGSAGIAFAPESICRTAEEAARAARAIGFPVVVKILSPDIVHKSDIGGVKLGLNDANAVRAAHDEVVAAALRAQPAARIDGTLVAKQITGGVECIMGVLRDPIFGPIAMFGLGGIFVEVIKDAVFKRCPFDAITAREMILDIKAAPLLTGARGRSPVDIDALATMLANLSRFAAAAGGSIASIDLNPVLALPAGQGAYAVDAVIDVAGTATNDGALR